MELIVTPYEGVGFIKFGMDRIKVRQVMGGIVEEFKKTPFSEMTTDSFTDTGIHVYYKKSDICEAIEMAFPASPSFQDKLLIGRSFNVLKKYFEKIDADVVIDQEGLTSFKFGIGLYAPNASIRPDDFVEGVIVFEKGYYG